MGGVGAQRRVLRRQPHPRRGQRARALARRVRPARRARAARTSTSSTPRVERYGIDCDFQRTGELTVATEPHQVADLHPTDPDDPDEAFWDRDQIQAEVHSPTYLAAHLDRTTALVDPARAGVGPGRRVRGASACASSSTRRCTGMATAPAGGDRPAHAPGARSAARQVALGHQRVPVAGAADPAAHRAGLRLRADDRAALAPSSSTPIGWAGRQGIGDSANQFHYYRLTADDRILWGGYDAVYHFGGRVRDRYDQRPATAAAPGRALLRHVPAARRAAVHPRLGRADRHVHPVLRLLRHRARAAGWPTPPGFTGLGRRRHPLRRRRHARPARRRADTERTRLRMVQTMPVPFPPEPIAWAGITATRWSLARADADEGRRNLWLRTLDRLGLGFDS